MDGAYKYRKTTFVCFYIESDQRKFCDSIRFKCARYSSITYFFIEVKYSMLILLCLFTEYSKTGRAIDVENHFVCLLSAKHAIWMKQFFFIVCTELFCLWHDILVSLWREFSKFVRKVFGRYQNFRKPLFKIYWIRNTLRNKIIKTF